MKCEDCKTNEATHTVYYGDSFASIDVSYCDACDSGKSGEYR